MSINISTETKGGAIVLRPEVEYIDVSNSAEFGQLLKQQLSRNLPVVIDMGHVKFVDSAALGALLSFAREARAVAVNVKLFNLTAPVRSTLQLVRLHRVFHIVGDLEEALLSLATTPGAKPESNEVGVE